MEFVEQLKQSVDIVQAIGEYVRLRKIGQRYTGLCPFHNEKTPSFSVNPQHQFFKCFGCGEAGDVLNFVMKYEGISFFEALKLLAERNGIPMPKRLGYSDEESRSRDATYQIHEIAAREFRRALTSEAGAEARSYLAQRGVSADSIEQFGLGYSPRNGALAKLLQKSFSGAEIEQSGLVLKREDGTVFDRFRNRLMFPIHSESGKVIAFGGRALAPGEQPKYLNSPETKIYRKSQVLYNLHRAKDSIRKLDRAVLVEGYMDVIGASAAGVGEVIASCGTSLTSQQVQALRRQTFQISVNFDPDNAGASAAERSIQMLLAEGLRVRVVALEDGLDPDEFCRKHGPGAYIDRIENAQGYFHWLADRARGKFDMRSAEGRYAAFQFLMPAIQVLGDKLERVAVANDIAGYLGVSSGLVLESFRKMAANPKQAATAPPKEQLRHADRILLRVLMANSGNREQFTPFLRGAAALKSSRAARLFEALLALEEAGTPATYAALNARLSEADQSLLAEALLRDETEAREPTVQEGIACLEALVEEERMRERAELKARVREAERTNNLTEALRLTGELHRIQNSVERI